MNKRRKITRGPAGAEKITFAPTDQVESFGELANEFMENIFELEPGEYLITDESDLSDFADFNSNDTSRIWASIEERYRVHRADVGSERLVRILSAIVQRRNVQ